MELHFVLVTLCVIVPVAWGQADFASLLGSLGFGGGKKWFLLGRHGKKHTLVCLKKNLCIPEIKFLSDRTYFRSLDFIKHLSQTLSVYG